MDYYSYMLRFCGDLRKSATVAMDALGGERASSEPGKSSGKSPKVKSLEEHDRQFHPNGYKPGDTCTFRDGLESYSDTDDIGDALNWKQNGRYLTKCHSSARFVRDVVPTDPDDLAWGGKRVARAKLPANTDPNKKLEKMFSMAEENLDALNIITNATATDAKLTPAYRPVNTAYHPQNQKYSNSKGLPIKTWSRAMQKSDTWHRDKNGNFGDYQQLNDLIGNTLILNDDDSFVDAVEHLEENVRKVGASIAQVKPYNLTTGKPGYRDLKVTVRFPNGGLGEMIVIEGFMNKQKFEHYGHAAYEAWRIFNGMVECGDKDAIPLVAEIKSMMNMLYERDASKIDDKKFAEQKKILGSKLREILENPDSFMPRMPSHYRPDVQDYAKKQKFFEQERIDNLKALEKIVKPKDGDRSGLSSWEKMRLADPEDRITLQSNQNTSQRPLTTATQA